MLSGFDRRNCYISVLAWNNGTVEGNALINISHVPYDNFHVEVFRLDEDHMPGVSRCLACLLTQHSDREFPFRPLPIFSLHVMHASLCRGLYDPQDSGCAGTNRPVSMPFCQRPCPCLVYATYLVDNC